MTEKKKSILSSPWIWCLTTYFAEGFPYSIIRTVSPVYFRSVGVSLQGVGLSSLFGLPWILKFLWGPYVDGFSSKRRWMLTMQGLLAVLFLASAFVTFSPGAPAWIGLLFFIGSFIAATHDTAIDGYYLAALDKEGQARFVGYRIMAYRLAMITGSGIIVTLATHIHWALGFAATGVILFLFWFFHFSFLSEPETPARPAAEMAGLAWNNRAIRLFFLLLTLFIVIILISPTVKAGVLKIFSGRNFSKAVAVILLFILACIALYRRNIGRLLTRSPDSFYSRAFLSFMDQPRIGWLLAFIILVRAGEWSMANMVPSFMIDLGLKKQYGWISGFVGLPCAIIGALIGGWLISRYSMKRTIWPFLLLQNLTNVIYMTVAFKLHNYLLLNTGTENPVPMKFMELVLVAGVNGFDQFAGGLGNAVLALYLMRLCKKEFKAAHYAIGSGLMSLTGIFVGVASGFITAGVGYGWFFGISFLFSLPGMILVFFIPRD